jgi:hypothetical protein
MHLAVFYAERARVCSIYCRPVQEGVPGAATSLALGDKGCCFNIFNWGKTAFGAEKILY